HVFARETLSALAPMIGDDARGAEHALRRHLGICLDACHLAVEYESPLQAMRELTAAGIAIPKIQLSAGLRLPDASPERCRALSAFAEEVYLHQVVRRGDAGLTRFVDLPEALAAA